MNDKNLRDHGYPDVGDTPSGTPTAEPAGKDTPCPNCGCHLMLVTVSMNNKLVKGGKGVGRYLGCPACPFASPMVTRGA